MEINKAKPVTFCLRISESVTNVNPQYYRLSPGAGRPPSLAEGMRAEELIQKLRGVCCGSKGTSCSDQLAALLEEALGE